MYKDNMEKDICSYLLQLHAQAVEHENAGKLGLAQALRELIIRLAQEIEE